MKKKLLSLLALALCLSLPVAAQVSFGPKVVAHQTNIGDHKFIFNDKMYASFGDAASYGDLTYNYGAFVRYGFSRVYLQAEVLLSDYSSRIDFIRNPEELSYIENQEIMYADFTTTMKRLEAPTIVGVKIGSFWVQAGLVSAVPLQAKLTYTFEKSVVSEEDPTMTYQETVSGEIDEKDYYNKFQLDGQLGLGVTILKRVMIGVDYQTNLTNRRESIELLDQSANPGEKMNSIGLWLGINLGRIH